MLFLYSQSEKEAVEQYGRNFLAFWETVEAFGGSPGVHQGMINVLLKDPTQIASVGSPTTSEKKKAEDVDPLIPGHGQTIPRSVSRTRQHHLNVAREPTWLS